MSKKKESSDEKPKKKRAVLSGNVRAVKKTTKKKVTGTAKPGKTIVEDKFAEQLENLLAELKLTTIVIEREFKFHPDRRWRCDFRLVDMLGPNNLGIIAEIEGGIFTGGRHVHPLGFTNDCEKYNEATIMGYRVLRFPSSTVKDGTAIEMVRRILT